MTSRLVRLALPPFLLLSFPITSCFGPTATFGQHCLRSAFLSYFFDQVFAIRIFLGLLWRLKLLLIHLSDLIWPPTTLIPGFQGIKFFSNDRPLPQQPVNFIGNPDLHPCLSCDERHEWQDCKFRQVECYKCHKKGHLARVCRSKNITSFPVGSARNTASGKLHARKGNETLGRPHSFINRITSPYFAPVLQFQQTGNFVTRLYMNAHPLSIQLDTESPITILSCNNWKNIGSPALNPVSVCAQSYSGDSLSFTGEVSTKLEFQGRVFSTIVQITNTSAISILGRDIILLLGLDNVPIKSFCNVVLEDGALSKLLP